MCLFFRDVAVRAQNFLERIEADGALVGKIKEVEELVNRQELLLIEVPGDEENDDFSEETQLRKFAHVQKELFYF